MKLRKAWRVQGPVGNPIDIANNDPRIVFWKKAAKANPNRFFYERIFIVK